MSTHNRGRVVMLVDNKVEGDSRVQKEARSMAARGWDVVLLGRSPDRQTHRWQIGDAKVRLVPMPVPLLRPRHTFRRSPLRAPLAYPAGPLANYQRQHALARRADARTRKDELTRKLAEAPRDTPALRAERALVWLNRAYAKARGELVELRVKQTEQLARSRQAMDAPLDVLATRFWRTTMGNRSWRRLDPNLWDWELAYGPVVDELAPDLIHANDFRMIGVGARAKLRAAAQGRTIRLVWDAHEFLPGRDVANVHPRWHEAQIAHEAEFVPYADAVVTTSEMMVELLGSAHRLPGTPAIVRNAPTVGLDSEVDTGPGVRALCGLADDVPLLLYIGVTAPQRGVDTMIEALPRLDGVHVALVAKQSPNLERLTSLAAELGVSDRVHPLPYVPVDHIVGHIASVDVGVFPALHNLSHDSDLPTKFYEYAQARLPMVVSDVRTTAETTRMLGQGEVFRAGDVDDYLRAVRAVLADLPRYRKAYDEHPDLLAEWMWEPQADVLDAVYTRLIETS
jgi:glycosyltransferase involved in cell wall biosynthesis